MGMDPPAPSRAALLLRRLASNFGRWRAMILVPVNRSLAFAESSGQVPPARISCLISGTALTILRVEYAHKFYREMLSLEILQRDWLCRAT